MSDDDLEVLVRGDGDPLEREVLGSARDDAPSSNAKAQMLASLGLAKPPSTVRGPVSPVRKSGGRYVYGVGLALVIGAGAAAIVSTSRGGTAPTSTPGPAMPSETALSAPAAPLLAAPSPPEHAPVIEAASSRAPATASAAPLRRREAPLAVSSAPREPPSPSASSVSPTGEPSQAAPPASSSGESTLARELARVTAARSALAAGDSASTLQLLDTYDSEFPSGAFTVEVSVLRIEALARSGKIAEATRLGDRFLAQHPQGAFARRVTVTLKSVNPSPRDPAPSRD